MTQKELQTHRNLNWKAKYYKDVNSPQINLQIQFISKDNSSWIFLVEFGKNEEYTQNLFNLQATNITFAYNFLHKTCVLQLKVTTFLFSFYFYKHCQQSPFFFSLLFLQKSSKIYYINKINIINYKFIIYKYIINKIYNKMYTILNKLNIYKI